MLKATIDNGRTMVTAKGSTLELLAEVSEIISVVYQQLNDDTDKNAIREMFRASLVRFLTDADSPLFVPMGEDSEA